MQDHSLLQMIYSLPVYWAVAAWPPTFMSSCLRPTGPASVCLQHSQPRPHPVSVKGGAATCRARTEFSWKWHASNKQYWWWRRKRKLRRVWQSKFNCYKWHVRQVQVVVEENTRRSEFNFTHEMNVSRDNVDGGNALPTASCQHERKTSCSLTESK